LKGNQGRKEIKVEKKSRSKRNQGRKEIKVEKKSRSKGKALGKGKLIPSKQGSKIQIYDISRGLN
jgi:hypothetical protein